MADNKKSIFSEQANFGKKNWADDDDDQESDADEVEVGGDQQKNEGPSRQMMETNLNKEKAEVEEAKKIWAAPEMRDRNANGDFVVTSINIPDMVKVEANNEEEESDEDSESEEE